MKYFNGFSRLIKAFIKSPTIFVKSVNTIPSICEAYEFSHNYKGFQPETDTLETAITNPLKEYFENHREGHGIFKWEHYFDIYHRHFEKFIGQKVNILEIGIYSGGSLEMWRSYFGNNCHIYGVDIEEACLEYQNDNISVFIGDQEDRNFWQEFRKNVADIDIIIDDGGHTPEQQRITLEEFLPALNPGGVYLCEDIHGHFNRFSAFAAGLVNELNHQSGVPGEVLQSSVSKFQSSVHSIHFYPYITVIEKNSAPLKKLQAPKHGTKWQPFLS
ncbi:class I SAM-dependent methyltransferase [soil metagenome]